MRKLIACIILCLIFVACEKEPIVNRYIGDWKGVQITALPWENQADTMNSYKNIYMHGDSLIIKQWTAPLVESYIQYYDETHYHTKFELRATPTCNGITRYTTLWYDGIGKLVGDSIVEEGTVIESMKDSINANDSTIIIGVWKSMLKRYN